MNSLQEKQDLPFLLFLVPFAASGIYAIFLWVTTGISATLPSSVFLQVTENPYIFLVGFLAVIAGVTLDVLQEEPAKRRAALLHESSTLQKLALVTLVLGAVCALYAGKFDVGTAAGYIAEGRYAIVFPALLVLFSFLFLPTLTMKTSQVRNVVVVVLLLAVPLSVDELGKRNFFAGMAVGLVLVAIALYLYLSTRNSSGKSTT